MSYRNGENFGDRFVRSRQQLFAIAFHVHKDDQKEELVVIANEDYKKKQYFNHGLKTYKKNNYRNELAVALGLMSPEATFFQTISETWPTKPRKIPFIEEPIFIRNVKDGINLEMCDLNQHNVMAGIYRNKSLLCWIPESHAGCEVNTQLIDTQCVLTGCVQFNVNGNLLAIAKRHSGFIISVFDNKNMDIEILDMKDIFLRNTTTCFEWSKKDVLYVGCFDGSIHKYNIANVRLLKNVDQCHIPNVKAKKRILSMKLSSNENYMAISSMDKYFRVLSLKNFDVLLSAKLLLPIKCFAWHPWRECLIATQYDPQNGTLKLWNISSPKDTIEQKLDENNSKSIDYLTFNKLSGELVITYYDTTNQHCFIKVLSSFTQSSEIIEWNVGRIPKLIWCKDNKVLVAVSAGNSYSFWNFFNESNDLVKQDFNGNRLSQIR